MTLNSTTILKSHQLRITDCRVHVLDFLLSADHAVSSRELELAFVEYDRVTLYRTLHSFEESGIIHSIPNETGVARYGVCFETCEPGHHTHSHAHFKCDQCGTIACIPSQKVPKVDLPGYLVTESNLILSGTCVACNRN